MKKTILFLLMAAPLVLFGQHLEIGATVGGSNYVGELSSNSSTIQFGETNLSAGVFARLNLNRMLALKLQGQFTKLSGADANSSNRAIIDRNLNFQTKIQEIGIMGEFNILGFDAYAGSFSPYVFAGVAFYKFDPETNDSTNVKLQPLGTEGQGLAAYPERLPYELNQLAIPFGLGVKYAVSENFHVGLEVGARKLFTDYIDDVSLTYPGIESFDPTTLSGQFSDRSLSGAAAGQGRGDTKANDWYYIANLTISYNFLDTGTIGGRKGRKSKMGCPTF